MSSPTPVTVLGIETSCDETAASVVRDGHLVLSSVVASQHDLHAEYAGVVPEIASRAHVEAILPVVREALAQAGLGLGMIDAIAVGNRPGLIGSLLVGVAAAKALAWSLGRPVIGVDHVHAHLYSGLLKREDTARASAGARTHALADASQAPFPALGLVVSGGHTALFDLQDWTDVRRIGSTIDDALGEAYDKVASILALPHPGGPRLDQLAQTGNDRALTFPVSRLGHTSLDFSFSGLKTSVRYAVQGVPGERGEPAPPLTPQRARDIAASFQRAACDAVALKLRRAIEQARARGLEYRVLLTGGGVTANSRLRATLASIAQETSLPLVLPALEDTMDNAAMIAGLGHALLSRGVRSDMSLPALASSTA